MKHKVTTVWRVGGVWVRRGGSELVLKEEFCFFRKLCDFVIPQLA